MRHNDDDTNDDDEEDEDIEENTASTMKIEETADDKNDVRMAMTKDDGGVVSKCYYSFVVSER